MWWPTFIKGAKEMNQAQVWGLEHLVAEHDAPKPGYAGGIGEVRPYRGPAGTFDIAALGTGPEKTGLIKSLRQDGSFEGTVYVVPFHAHVEVKTLASAATFQVQQEAVSLCTVPDLRAGSVLEITFTTTAAPAGRLDVLLSHQGFVLPGNTVTLNNLGPGRRVRVVLSGVTLAIAAQGGPTTLRDLRVVHHQDLAICLGKTIMDGVRHRGGVTFDVLEKQP